MSLPDAYLAEFSEPSGYMNFGAIGPVSNRVRTTVDGLLGEIAAARGNVADAVLPRYEAATGVIADFMGVVPERATAIPVTSAGLFQVAFGMLGWGGNVVVPPMSSRQTSTRGYGRKQQAVQRCGSSTCPMAG